MSYKNTFITASEDSTVISAVVPIPKNEKPTIASIEYDLIYHNPYKYTQEDIQFQTYLIKNPAKPYTLEELQKQFSAKSKACFRASPLVKKYGWGIHYDEEGKIAIYDMNSEPYKQFLQSGDMTILKGMRSKRK